MIAAWNRFRDETEQLAREIGGALRDVVRADAWPNLSLDERLAAIEEARRLIHERHGLVRETWIVWEEGDDPGLGYNETSGAIHFPRHHLETASAEQLVGGLAEEMRHAWQFDVVDGRLEHPLGDLGRDRLGDAHAVYDAENTVAYTGSELEMDAQDFAADIVAGWRGAP